MHILLLILKIIGFTLLGILGLLLFILLLLLLVPIRYKGQLAKKDSLEGSAVVSWLLHLIHVRVELSKDAISNTVRICGFVISGSDKTVKNETNKSDSCAEAVKSEQPEGKPESAEVVKSEQTKSKLERAEAVKSEQPEGKSESNEVAKPEQAKSKPESAEAAKLEQPEGNETAKSRQTSSKSEYAETKVQMTDKEPEDRVDSRADTDSKTDSDSRAVTDSKTNSDSRNSNMSDVDQKIENAGKKLAGIMEKVEHYKSIIDDPKLKKALSLVWHQVVKLLKHVLPRRLRGQIRFGFEDPSTTGYVLAACGILYGTYAKSFEVYPDFENQLFEADVSFKGKIRLGSILMMVLRVIIDRNFRYSYKLLKKEFGGQ